jgi:hypothetical protein
MEKNLEWGGGAQNIFNLILYIYNYITFAIKITQDTCTS